MTPPSRSDARDEAPAAGSQRPAPLQWRAGEPALRAAVERALGPDGDVVQVLRDNARRRLLQVHADGGALIVKHYRTATGRHVRRERWKARLGQSPAEREWRALRALRKAGVPVPEALGLARFADGDPILVIGFEEGCSLDEALCSPRPERRALLARLGAAVAALHAAGFVHGDLHRGNIWIGPEGPILLDLQEARRSGSRRGRTADLGDLDYSLWQLTSLPDRLQLRAAALARSRPFDADARNALRAVGKAAERRAWRHGRSRTRRSLRPGRQYARIALGEQRGLRVRELPAERIETAIAAHHEALAGADGQVLKRDARCRVTGVRSGELDLIVKEMLPRRLSRRLADAVRGSGGRRAWRAGHGLLERNIGAARPLAFLEDRSFGLPGRSLVVLEDLRPSARDALEALADDPEAVADAVAQLLVALHRRGVDHGDLKATNLFLPRRPGEPAKLIDLEAVRFRRRLRDDRRLDALAEINASLPDGLPAWLRRRAFARYASVLRFAGGSPAALREVVARSLARRHRWQGEDCALAKAKADR